MFDRKTDNKPDTRAKFLICSGTLDLSKTTGPLQIENERVLAYADDFLDMLTIMFERPAATFVKCLQPDLTGNLKYVIKDRSQIGRDFCKLLADVRARVVPPMIPTAAAETVPSPMLHIQV